MGMSGRLSAGAGTAIRKAASEMCLRGRLSAGWSGCDGWPERVEADGLIFRVGEIHTVRSACLASDHAAQALIGASRVHQYHMGALLIILAHEVVPVSYTHLDVYKRQIRHNATALNIDVLLFLLFSMFIVLRFLDGFTTNLPNGD